MKKILIAVVEDDLDDQDFLCHAFEESGENILVSRFNNGHDFIDFLIAAQSYPGIVITDIRMPLVSGWDVINQLKSDTRTNDIPVVVVSTSASELDKEKAARL